MCHGCNLCVDQGVLDGVTDVDCSTSGVISGCWGVAVPQDTLTELYLAHFAALVRLAVLLLDEPAAGEDVVQEAYIRVASARRHLRNPDAALAYLRRTVLNLSRSEMRRRMTAARHLPSVSSPEAGRDELHDLVERDALVSALRALPRRQREAVALRYYADLSEAQTAEVMGVSVGTVKSQTSRGLEQLSRRMEATR